MPPSDLPEIISFYVFQHSFVLFDFSDRHVHGIIETSIHIGSNWGGGRMEQKKGILILALTALIYGAVYLAMSHNLAMKTAALAARPVTIVIDAGHGGEDGGALSDSGDRESDLNLAISLKLEQLLAFCGMKTQMIRENDVSVYTSGDTVTERKVSDLKNRVALVNAAGPAILISIHQNQFAQSKYSGAQVFYAGTDGSKELAGMTQLLLRQTIDPDNRREIKRADTVFLMEKIKCTGILVECGFLSNQQEAALLRQGPYQTKIICAIGSALAQFLEEGKNLEV